MGSAARAKSDEADAPLQREDVLPIHDDMAEARAADGVGGQPRFHAHVDVEGLEPRLERDTGDRCDSTSTGCSPTRPTTTVYCRRGRQASTPVRAMPGTSEVRACSVGYSRSDRRTASDIRRARSDATCTSTGESCRRVPCCHGECGASRDFLVHARSVTTTSARSIASLAATKALNRSMRSPFLPATRARSVANHGTPGLSLAHEVLDRVLHLPVAVDAENGVLRSSGKVADPS